MVITFKGRLNSLQQTKRAKLYNIITNSSLKGEKQPLIFDSSRFSTREPQGEGEGVAERKREKMPRKLREMEGGDINKG